MATEKSKDSPNSDIDKAIKELMGKIKADGVPPDVAVKIVNTAIAWEKAKHGIKDKENGFDPDSI